MTNLSEHTDMTRQCSPSAKKMSPMFASGAELLAHYSGEMAPTFTAGLAGLGFGLSLIVAIGAQNAFVLRLLQQDTKNT